MSNSDVTFPTFVYDEIIKLLPVAVSVYSRDFELLMWNDQYLSLSGLTQDQVYKGMSLAEKIAAENQNELPPSTFIPIVEQVKCYWQDPLHHRREDWFENGRLIETRVKRLSEDLYVFCYIDITESRLYENHLQSLSEEDPLTKTLNRRSFGQQVESLILQHRKQHEPFAVLMLDIDYFKLVNDEYGHHVGDEVLIALAQCCRTVLKEHDLLGRLGGEEFCIVLPNRTLTMAKEIASSILQNVNSTPVVTNDIEVSFTVSIGVTEYCALDRTFDSIYQRVDTALHAAKKAGRNCFKTL